ncbi:atp-dependent clp protease atp-binding subunit clpx [Stemphylium lycopersici]|uniref:Atp-dependent clp protease atp-binding subunit clpx n=1 Tax=Stemphylium lycopersici TaxID=183478 RepID=A0A364N0W3_STELY|nr:atp-dependent clp protease atp-binding subunit clpx [Stemphylium lycopersici]RAR08897.1 atp-dependent clp protease atp-binding subunit clpx [Stemphylium lycopersici]
MILRRAIQRPLPAAVSPQARASYLALYSISRCTGLSHSHTRKSSRFNRSDFTGQAFSSFYEPDQPTRGPLGSTSNVGAGHITPKVLRQHLDQFVVDQDRAKIVLSVAVHEHHLRIQEIKRQLHEQARLEAQAQRRASVFRHPVEGSPKSRPDPLPDPFKNDFSRHPLILRLSEKADEFPGQQPTVELHSPSDAPSYGEAPAYRSASETATDPDSFLDTSEHQLQIEKSNVLILGPTGVGKTLMCKTLAKTLGLPISMSDCTTFTQAGYIGDDVESCVARLFSAANYDIDATEHGIIVLDEIDKIAGAKISYGKDVGGEGVQQALLKIIEGTTVQVQAKPEKSANRPGGLHGTGRMDTPQPPGPGANKGEVYNIRTDNILFICTGAFSNLHKIILDRKSKGGMGFGASIRATNAHAAADGVMLTGTEAESFKKDSPFFVPPKTEVPNPFGVRQVEKPEKVNVLDHVQPADLQKFGMIPELIGRIPTVCAVAALDEDALVRVLTEPKDSLIRQEEHKSYLRNIEMRFTNGALREIARKASRMGTGARGLRHVVDQLLLQAKYETPGSSVKHILVTQDVALLKRAPLYFHRGQSAAFEAAHAQEEEKWEEELRSHEDPSIAPASNFQEYRKAGAAGF